MTPKARQTLLPPRSAPLSPCRLSAVRPTRQLIAASTSAPLALPVRLAAAFRPRLAFTGRRPARISGGCRWVLLRHRQGARINWRFGSPLPGERLVATRNVIGSTRLDADAKAFRATRWRVRLRLRLGLLLLLLLRLLLRLRLRLLGLRLWLRLRLWRGRHDHSGPFRSSLQGRRPR